MSYPRPVNHELSAMACPMSLHDLDLSGDGAHGTGLRHELTPEQNADMVARLDGFQDYIYDHVTAKRRDPQDDMVSFLCGVHYEALDRQLTDLEIAGIVHAMIIGGLETT